MTKYILIYIIGVIAGIGVGFLVAPLLLFPRHIKPTLVPYWNGNEGCIVDGTITRQNGTVSPNWVCVDTNWKS